MFRRSISILILVNFLLIGQGVWARQNSARSKRFSVVRKINSKNPKSRYTQVYDKKLKRNRMMKDTVIIRFKPSTSESEIYDYAELNNLKLVEELIDGTYLFKDLSKLNAVNNIARRFRKIENDEDKNEEDENLDSIVENYDIDEYKLVKTDALRRTKLSRLQWYLSNDGQNGLRAGADINVERAWSYTKGSGVKVAVIDTGFDLGHYDIDYAEGYDAQEESSDAAAPVKSNENHGTAVAGIIAANDDGKGIVGVAPDSEIIPIRLIDDTGRVSVSQIIKSFQRANELGAQVINNSWGSYDPSLPEGELLEITDLEKEVYSDLAKNGNDGKGILIIFASGNSGEANFNNAPEARLPETFAVGATDSTDRRASYSVYGEELDLVAPGGGYKTILTTDRRDLKVKRGGRVKRKVIGYSRGSVVKGFKGTSAAAPVVAGVAALIWSLRPDLNVEDVKTILRDSANRRMNSEYIFDDYNKNSQVGYGRVDAGRAVSMADEY